MGKLLPLLILSFLILGENLNAGTPFDVDNPTISFLTANEKRQLLFSYKSYYFLKEIQDFEAGYYSPLHSKLIGIKYKFFGGKLYNENTLRTLISMNYGLFYYGLRGGLSLINIANDNSFVKIKMDLFALAKISDSLNWSIDIKDIQSFWYDESYSISTKFNYDNGNFLFVGGIEYNSEESINFKLRSGYRIFDGLVLYFGLNSLPHKFIAGFNYTGGKISLGDEVQIQNELGINEHINLAFDMGVVNHGVQNNVLTVYDLNKVTFNDLLAIGIESDISCAIIDYRDSIGEYFDMVDLININGIGMNWVKKHSSILTVKWDKLDINRVGLLRLKTTPRIKKRILKGIIKYRTTHIIRDLSEFKRVKGVNSEVIKTLKKYYKCEV